MAAESTYATTAEVDTYATDNGRTEWAGLTSDQKTRAVVAATYDITRYHKQTNFDGTLWLSTDADLKKACEIQAIYAGTLFSYSDMSDRIGVISSGSYEDGNLTVSGAGRRALHPDAKYLVNNVMSDYAISASSFSRG